MAGGENDWEVKGGGRRNRKQKPSLVWTVGGKGGGSSWVGAGPSDTWTCGACGTGANWSTRTSCRACGAGRPGYKGKGKVTSTPEVGQWSRTSFPPVAARPWRAAAEAKAPTALQKLEERRKVLVQCAKDWGGDAPHLDQAVADVDRQIQDAKAERTQAKPLSGQLREAQVQLGQIDRQLERLAETERKANQMLLEVKKERDEAAKRKEELATTILELQGKIAVAGPAAPASNLDVIRVQLECIAKSVGSDIQSLGLNFATLESLLEAKAKEGAAKAEAADTGAAKQPGQADDGDGTEDESMGDIVGAEELPPGVTETERKWINGQEPVPDQEENPHLFKRYQEVLMSVHSCQLVQLRQSGKALPWDDSRWNPEGWEAEFGGCESEGHRRDVEQMDDERGGRAAAGASQRAGSVARSTPAGPVRGPRPAALARSEHGALRAGSVARSTPAGPSRGFVPAATARSQGADSGQWRGYARVLHDNRMMRLLVDKVNDDKQVVIVWTFNGSGWGTIREKLLEKKVGQQKHIYAFQEHRLKEDQWAGVTHSMRQRGYQVGGAVAVPTLGPMGEPGTSAGVGIAVPNRIGMAYVCGQTSWDWSPRGSPGRAAAAWVAVGRGGIVVATVYLWTAEQMSRRNRGLMDHVLGKLHELNMPWVLCGDFQNAPAVLAGLDSIKLIGATLVAPSAASGTCRTASGCSTIDYFVVSRELAGQVRKVAIHESWPSAPHKPVGITLDLRPQERKERILITPKKLEGISIGRAPEPPVYDEVGVFSDVAVATRTWASFIGKLEREAFALRGLEWHPRHECAGRADPPRWKERAILRGGGNHPAPQGDALWWRWLARSLQTLAGNYERLRSSSGSARARQEWCMIASDLEERFRSVSHEFRCELVGEEKERWRERCTLLAKGRWRGADQKASLDAMILEAKERSRREDQDLINERRRQWAAKLEEAAKGAAGGLHRISKPVDIWRPRRASTPQASADPLRAAEAALGEWNAVWKVNDPMQEQERRWETEPRQELPEFTEGDLAKLKKVARTFKRKTAQGVDRWHPSMLLGASDAAHWTLLQILREVERTLVWPQHAATVIFFLIPKSVAVDRAIGLLPTLVRVWEIMREPYMIEWAKANQRSWDCTAFGKAAEDAAWEVLLANEGDEVQDSDPRTLATVTAILDLVKAFERVSLHVLWERGKAMGFNTGVLAVVCSYFAMARRVNTGEAISEETRTVATIIAGSKFSVGFLKMVIQDTIDGLVVEYPLVQWRMYVDDLCLKQRGAQQWIVDSFPSVVDDSVDGFAALGLEFSLGDQGKGAVMASTKWLRQALKQDAAERGLPMVLACPYLGVDVVAHGTAAKNKSGKRFKRMRNRVARLKGLKGSGKGVTRGIGLVYKCGLKRSVMYGCKCLGMPDHQLQQVRRAAGQLLPGSRGAKSLTLQLAVLKEDPTEEATLAPVVRWARAVWEQAVAGDLRVLVAGGQGQAQPCRQQAFCPEAGARLRDALGVWTALWIKDLRGEKHQRQEDWSQWSVPLVAEYLQEAAQAGLRSELRREAASKATGGSLPQEEAQEAEYLAAEVCRRAWRRACWRRRAAFRYLDALDEDCRAQVISQYRQEQVALQKVVRRLLVSRGAQCPWEGSEGGMQEEEGYLGVSTIESLVELLLVAGSQMEIAEDKISRRTSVGSEAVLLSEQMSNAWRQQQKEVGMSPQWAKVKGPAGAVIMSLRRARWTWPSWTVYCTKDGEMVDLTAVCPTDVGALLRADLRKVLWEQWTAQQPGMESLAPGPRLPPVVAQLAARAFPAHAKRAARKVVLAGAWTMNRLAEVSITPTDICIGCGLAVGTPHHRFFRCPALLEVRRRAQAEWQHVAEQQEDSLLWTRGLARDPSADWAHRSVDEADFHCDVLQGTDALLSGDIVCDGSKLGTSCWAQAGWAAMAIDAGGAPTVQLWGPLPCRFKEQKTVKRAEMWAFLKTLETVLPPCRIFTDHQGILDGIRRGPRWCLSWGRPRADVWRRIWHKIADVGLEPEWVMHVKAHRSRVAISRLEGLAQQVARGNEAVDALAKRGAAEDIGHGREQTLESLDEKVKWAIQNIGWWCQEMKEGWPDVPPRTGPSRRRKQQRPYVSLTRHEVEVCGAWLVCTRCGKRAASA
ncbi:unnamed protein product, partial [Prorocentrum cordatum]